MKQKTKLMLGDNMESLKKLPDNSIDSVVSDPPYGLSFMGKKWDYDVPSVEFWREVYRVLKPGGHILSFGGTRTYHRMVVNIEDAGFEIRDQIMWLYGSGFPKSHNIGKAVDKLEGNEREIVSIEERQLKNGGKEDWLISDKKRENIEYNITKGKSDWEGWGTALKPANEPICLARKPLSEKSIAENVLKWRTGGINVDGCRIGSDIIPSPQQNTNGGLFMRNSNIKNETIMNEGRFPANIILECICDEVIKGEKGEVKSNTRNRSSMKDNGYGFGEEIEAIDNYNDKGDIHTNPNCPCRLLDEQSGLSKSSPNKWEGEANIFNDGGNRHGFNDKGGASRFFYQAKVSKKERNMGLDGFEEKSPDYLPRYSKNENGDLTRADGSIVKPVINKNVHPTVKPVSLMAYLCRLITPENGIILDPFMGSGSTGIAAQLEGFRFVGMEMDVDYFKIAEARINSYEKYKEFNKK